MQKEHYLGLSFGNDNWWKTNGIGCREREVADGSGLGAEDSGSNTVECVASYAVSFQPHNNYYAQVILSF